MVDAVGSWQEALCTTMQSLGAGLTADSSPCKDAAITWYHVMNDASVPEAMQAAGAVVVPQSGRMLLPTALTPRSISDSDRDDSDGAVTVKVVSFDGDDATPVVVTQLQCAPLVQRWLYQCTCLSPLSPLPQSLLF